MSFYSYSMCEAVMAFNESNADYYIKLDNDYSVIKKVNSGEISFFDDDYRYLWGKNYPYNSDIKYEYYLDGIHSSYPDFIMKDKLGRIHIFEVKSVNKSGNMPVDEKEYERKVNELKECYRVSSALLPNHIFYLPIQKGDEWDIFKYEQGKPSITSLDEIRKEIS